MRSAPHGLAFALVLSGCPSPPQTPAVSTPEAPPPSAPAVTMCTGAEPFIGLGWIPPSTEALALVDTRAPTLSDALAQLAEGARSPERTLPIRVAFALGQWSWQVPLLDSTLERAGFDPAQLVHVTLPDGDSAWAWPQHCDLETVQANIATGWGLSVRTTPYGAVAVAGLTAEGEPDFPYDFIALGAAAYLVVPAGRARAVAQRLAERSLDPANPGIGDTASTVDPAPIRVLVRSGALLTPGAAAGPSDRLQAFRIDAHGWSTVEPSS